MRCHKVVVSRYPFAQSDSLPGVAELPLGRNNSLETVMGKNKRSSWLAITSAFVLSLRMANGQGGAPSGVYEIVAGTYTECCGFGGNFSFSVPNESQRFVAVDMRRDLATMTFLGQDLRTVFSVVPCPGGSSIPFRFDYGSTFSNSIIFHVDPGPPPYAVYWSYAITNSVNSLRINGTLGTAQQNCVDVPTRFSHSNVVAVLVPPPRIRITEFSENGALLSIQGRAGWITVVEASTDLVSWTGVSTNLMPATLCPVCPYILVRDAAATNMARRFYRCFQTP
jgi:hypothetical protein